MQLRCRRLQEYLIVPNGAGQGAQWLCTCITQGGSPEIDQLLGNEGLIGIQGIISFKYLAKAVAMASAVAGQRTLRPGVLDVPTESQIQELCAQSTATERARGWMGRSYS